MPEGADEAKPEHADSVGEVEARVPPRAPIRLRHRFYRRYGRAMGSWAALENILSHWFIWAIKPQEEGNPQISGIFYSARSFNGSADMLKAAFYAKPRDKELSDFFQAAINRTMGYYAFRNKLAHHIPTYDEQRGALVLCDPSALDDRQHSITERDFVIATRNFHFLWRIWLSTIPTLEPPTLLEPKLGLLCIDSLPAEAHSTEPSRKQRGRQRQRLLQRTSRG